VATVRCDRQERRLHEGARNEQTSRPSVRQRATGDARAVVRPRMSGPSAWRRRRRRHAELVFGILVGVAELARERLVTRDA
jgi:hypothetical protein